MTTAQNETETDSPNAPEAPEDFPNDAAPMEVETELPPAVETEAAPPPSQQQTDKLIEEAAASLTDTTTTTDPARQSQRIENK